jgi:hypothetical protein
VQVLYQELQMNELMFHVFLVMTVGLKSECHFVIFINFTQINYVSFDFLYIIKIVKLCKEKDDLSVSTVRPRSL